MKKISANAFILALLSSIIFLPSNLKANAQSLRLVSVNNKGTKSGNGNSYFSTLNANGRYVAFVSEADNLVKLPDNNGSPDVFVRDLLTGKITLVSINRDKTGTGNGGSSTPVISADGRFVAYVTDANNLVNNDTNGSIGDVILYDMKTGTSTLVSVNKNGTGSGNHNSLSPAITPDGQYIAFISVATDLVSQAKRPAQTDVFVRDLKAGVTKLVSISSDGTSAGNDWSSILTGGGAHDPSISDDGRFITFSSLATNLTEISDENRTNDIFVRDMVTNTTTLASINTAGTATGNFQSEDPSISADGHYVVFVSRSNNLVTNDPFGGSDIFMRDIQANTTTLVSVGMAGIAKGGDSFTPAISADGRFIAFASWANDLTPVPNVMRVNVYVRDMVAQATTLVSINKDGNGSGNDDSNAPIISRDGLVIGFQSRATNLATASDGESTIDVFVRDLRTEVTTLLSVNRTGMATGNASSLGPGLSADGRMATFSSFGNNFVENDKNSKDDVFAFQISIPPPSPPEIIEVTITGKNLTVTGNNFDIGAVLILNGQPQKTSNDSENPTTVLVSKRVGKKIKSNDRLRIRNSDGTESAEFIYP